MTSDARQTLGARGEQLAAEHLERLGYEILARNHRTRFGELDVVARDGEALVFVEVKTRRAGGGVPWDNLHSAKREQVRRMASAWLNDTPHRFFPELRFDAIGVTIDAGDRLVSLDHEIDAF